MEEEVVGRTFVDAGLDDTSVLARKHVLCFTLHAASVPANAQLFADVCEQIPLLRAFLHVSLKLWKDVGHAIGRIRWDSAGTTHLAVFFADDRFENTDHFANEALEALQNFIATDQRLAVRSMPRRTTAQWSAAHLLVDEQQWLTLQGTDASSTIGLAACSPVNAWRKPQNVAFHGPNTATLLRLHLRNNVFWHKLLPHQQEALYPDIPFSPSTANLLRCAATVPLPPGACKLSEWELFVARAHKMRHRNDYRTWALRQLQCTLQGKLAGFVPDVERALNEWPLEALQVPWIHSNLSSFGTWVNYMMTSMELYGFVFSQHLLCLKAFMGALDVYLEKAAGSLHFSMLLAGPASTSKSYTLQLLTNMLVPGTVSVATRRTANSKSYDCDSGAAIDIEHECPKEFFGSCKTNMGNPRGGQFKDVMTSHVFTTESLHITEDGRRKQIVSRSRCHRAMFAATNDFAAGGLDSNDEALLSRFDTVFPSMGGNRVSKDVLSVMIREKDPRPEDKLGMDRFLNHTRTLHVCLYWVMRCISARVLPDVNFSSLHLILSQVVQTLGIKAPPARTTERIFSLARVATIIQALVEEFGLPHAPQCNVIPCVKSVQAIRPRLVCTAEVAKFCIELQRGELEAPLQAKIMDGFKSVPLAPMEGNECYLFPKGCKNVAAVCRVVASACGASSGVTSEVVAMSLSKMQSWQLQNAPNYVSKPVGFEGNFPVELDKSDNERVSCCAAMGYAVHAHQLLHASAAGTSLDEALQSACRSCAHDEVRAKQVHAAPHRLHLRRRLDSPKPVNHKLMSGLFVSSEDWKAVGVAPPVDDLERNFESVQIAIDVERYAKRPRLEPPTTATLRYIPSTATKRQKLTHVYK